MFRKLLLFNSNSLEDYNLRIDCSIYMVYLLDINKYCLLYYISDHLGNICIFFYFYHNESFKGIWHILHYELKVFIMGMEDNFYNFCRTKFLLDMRDMTLNWSPNIRALHTKCIIFQYQKVNLQDRHIWMNFNHRCMMLDSFNIYLCFYSKN